MIFIFLAGLSHENFSDQPIISLWDEILSNSVLGAGRLQFFILCLEQANIDKRIPDKILNEIKKIIQKHIEMEEERISNFWLWHILKGCPNILRSTDIFDNLLRQACSDKIKNKGEMIEIIVILCETALKIDEVLEVLIKITKDDKNSDKDRMIAIANIGRLLMKNTSRSGHVENIRDTLMKLIIFDPISDIRSQATDTLARLAERKILDKEEFMQYLIKDLESEDSNIRTNVCQVLANDCVKINEFSDNIVEILSKLWEAKPSQEQQKLIIKVLRNPSLSLVGKAVYFVDKLVKEGDPKVRSLVAEALYNIVGKKSNFGKEWIVEKIMSYLNDEFSETRRMVLSSLDRLNVLYDQKITKKLECIVLEDGDFSVASYAFSLLFKVSMMPPTDSKLINTVTDLIEGIKNKKDKHDILFRRPPISLLKMADHTQKAFFSSYILALLMIIRTEENKRDSRMYSLTHFYEDLSDIDRLRVVQCFVEFLENDKFIVVKTSAEALRDLYRKLTEAELKMVLHAMLSAGLKKPKKSKKSRKYYKIFHCLTALIVRTLKNSITQEFLSTLKEEEFSQLQLENLKIHDFENSSLDLARIIGIYLNKGIWFDLVVNLIHSDLVQIKFEQEKIVVCKDKEIINIPFEQDINRKKAEKLRRKLEVLYEDSGVVESKSIHFIDSDEKDTSTNSEVGALITSDDSGLPSLLFEDNNFPLKEKASSSYASLLQSRLGAPPPKVGELKSSQQPTYVFPASARQVTSTIEDLPLPSNSLCSISSSSSMGHIEAAIATKEEGGLLPVRIVAQKPFEQNLHSLSDEYIIQNKDDPEIEPECRRRFGNPPIFS